MSKRFLIRTDPLWRPLLLAGGGTAANSYVEVHDDFVVFKFGLLFERKVARKDIEGARRRGWPLLYGIGWRTNFVGLIGLIGSREGVVEVKLRRRIRVWAGVFPCDRIVVSLEDPDGFIAALESAPEEKGAPAEEKPRAKRASRPRKPRKSRAGEG